MCMVCKNEKEKSIYLKKRNYNHCLHRKQTLPIQTNNIPVMLTMVTEVHSDRIWCMRVIKNITGKMIISYYCNIPSSTF